MRSSLDVRHKQGAVIKFLVLEVEPPLNIFKILEKIYGDAAIDRSGVKKWVLKVEKKIQV